MVLRSSENAFALASTLLFIMLNSSSYGQVVINEVLYDPPGADSGCFVELMGIPGFSLDNHFLMGINGENGKQYCLIDLTDHVSAALVPEMVQRADYIFAM